ncbi:MAG TPA: phosphate ABC transporter substrate-binding protein PstS, partial [Stellaceae bacterium]|nr:phosphate ABC transporter substrate-binding protein PstS [Stellaceae bacterium]
MSEKFNRGPALSRRQALGATLALAAMLKTGAALAADEAQILETGSTLLYPLFNLWVPDYQKTHPGVKITTQGTGSGTGISEAISGIAQIGASDAYMSNAQMRMDAGMINVPLAISSQMVNYNVPGLNGKHLKLSGPVLAGIYSGKITHWDDEELKKVNPGVKLPNLAIIPVHRSDGSGDTFIFTQYLTFSAPEWKSIGYGTTISWPAVQGGIGAVGNPGMVNACKGNPGAIAYIGISLKRATTEAKLGEAMLGNRAGRFVLANPKTVSAAVAATAAKTPKDERISLIFAPGAESYPIINYEYAIVNTAKAPPEVAKAVRAFLEWGISPQGGNAPKYMEAVGFVPLPV